MIFRHRTGEFDLSRRTLIIGIVNVTPDSFSDGGRFLGADAAVSHGIQLAVEGADVLDVGGESSRPGAEPVTEAEELRRVVPVIEQLSRRTHVPISVDTCKAGVATRAIEAGASIVNDISALRFDAAMAGIVARAKAGLILMHMQGSPRTMQARPEYADVVKEVGGFLSERIGFATRQGVETERIMVDPGIGFGKSVEHNLALLRGIPSLLSLDRPILIGTSRKSFIGKILDREVNERDWGTAATIAHAVSLGAHAVRVHNVALCGDVARMVDAVKVGA